MPDWKHTDAAEWDRFMALPQPAQWAEIWMNTRETNGHVAEAFKQIADLTKEVQKARIDHSLHIEATRPHAGASFLDQHQMMWFAFRVFLVLGPVSYAGLLAYILSRF